MMSVSHGVCVEKHRLHRSHRFVDLVARTSIGAAAAVVERRELTSLLRPALLHTSTFDEAEARTPKRSRRIHDGFVHRPVQPAMSSDVQTYTR